MSRSDDLFDEIHCNARNDRKRLESLCESIMRLADSSGVDAALLAESLSRLSDGLTKSNAQLVELAKILTKKEIISSATKGDDESDNLFDEIGDGFSREKPEEGEN